MAKKNEVVKNSKTKKQTATPAAKPVVKPKQTKPAATRNPAATPKPRKAASKLPLQSEKNNFVVFGTVKYTDAAPAAGMTVIAYDKDVTDTDTLGQPAVITLTGNFTIPYSEADFRKTKKEVDGADVIVCVYNTKQELLFTSKKKNNAPAKYELNITLPAEQFIVRGKVTDANQKPLANMFVRAYERDLRIPQFLGTDETKASGDFRIAYSLADFQLGEIPARRSPWLIVEVSVSANGEVLARQEVQKAARDQTVLFTLASVGAVSEWQRISETVAPLLKGQGGKRVEMATRSSVGDKRADLAPYDITPADEGFIVTETGLDRAAVEAWAASCKMARDAVSRLTDEYAAEQSLVGEHGWSFFYGLARQGLASDLDAALRASQQAWEKAWNAAQSAYRVPALNEKQVTSLMNVLLLLQRLQQLDSQHGSNSDLAKVLANLSQPLPKAIALDALAIFQEKGLGDIDALLKLAERHPDSEAPIKTFVRGVRVHQLTSGHEGFSRVVNARLEGSSDSIAPLARFPSTEWITMAAEASISLGLALQAQAQVEKQHPLTALQAKVSTGNFEFPGVSSGEVAALIKEQPEFTESILKGTKRIKDTVDGEDTPAAHKVLRDMGRFMHTGISMELGAELIKGGISSPGLALRYGEDFIRTQLLETLPKEAAYEVAASMFEFVEPIMHGANGFLRDVAGDRAQPAWMFEEVSLALPDSVRENLPTLPGLFGDLDECICRPCESMLGQPAYLVDLLNLLGENLRALLKMRRPGIFSLPLSCENADTNNTTQHIDIALEILENAGAPTATTNATKDEIQQLAYGNLASAIFPWKLPFDYDFAKFRAYIDKFGVARTSLQLLRTGTTPEQLAAEGLGLTFAQTASPGAKSEWQLLTEQRASVALWAVYGFDSSIGISLVDPASGEKLENIAIADVLTRVSVLIDRTGLELDELEQTFKTEFVSGYQGGLSFSNRDQCKTSEMRVPLDGEEGEEALLTGYLDRLHRFTRLRSKLPGWSVTQLNKAIAVCGGLENGQITADVLIQLATLKRLHEDHGIPLEHLFDMPASTNRLSKTLGLTELQFSLLKIVTALDLTVHLFNWAALEEFCNAAKRVRESGLSVEQVAQVQLTRDQLKSGALFGELPPMIKTDEQIEILLTSVQQRLRSVVAIRPDQTLESQVIEALSEIFDAATVDKLVNTMRDAGAATPTTPNIAAPSATLIAELVRKLSASTNATHILGEWLPLLDANHATEILTVLTDTGTTIPASGNLVAEARFVILMTGIAERRRERELIAVIAEQCGLSEPEIIALLGSRLWLAPPAAQGQPPAFASDAFLSSSFWGDVPSTDPAVPPSVTSSDFPLLHAWMDRLYRLISLGTALKIDGELMQIADGVAVGSGTGINWRDILAAVPATGSAWSNPNWQALLDMLWLQQPEQLSRPIFIEVSGRLATLARNGAQTVTIDAVRPLATRLEIAGAQILAIAAQATAVTTDNLRDPSKLRRIFKLLLLARHLGADDTQLTQIVNLADNAQAAATVTLLLDVRLGEQEHKEVWKSINDKLRQQRRDALVAYLLHRDKLLNANDLYEYYLIDPQIEPCFETTRVLEAITATQLFAQRILFGLEKDIKASQELKDRWTWMRNYRVWEANRKVFLFPENWLFPELRDDKSSSFKQLESALGQGELNQDLANQSFGQFLDDVAQMGQIEVLGMYEDISRASQGNVQSDKYGYPLRRTLYVIGRTLNPPYAYFWRHCVDYGNPYMEWSPWQRIELDIQGDHVLPFVLGGQLYIAWPLIRAIKIGSEGASKDGWEVKLAWSRHDGKSWRKSSVSRDFWSGEAAAFTDERRGFSFRGETALDDSKATIFVYAIADDTGAVREIEPTPADETISPIAWDLVTKNPIYATNATAALEFLKALVGDENGYNSLPSDTKEQVKIYEAIKTNWKQPGFVALDDMIKPIVDFGRSYIFQFPKKAIDRYEYLIGNIAPLPSHALNDPPTEYYRKRFVEEFLVAASWDVDVPSQKDYRYFNFFYNTLEKIASRRTVICKAWIKLTSPDGDVVSYLPLVPELNMGTYTCTIGTETISFEPGKAQPMAWKLGKQNGVDCTLTFVPDIRPSGTTILRAPPGVTYSLASIDAGYEATQTVHFVIDGSGHKAIEIGFDLDAFKTLKPVAKFHLTRDDMVTKLTPLTPQTPIYNPVFVSQPWMNGFREIAPMGDAALVSPLNIATRSLNIAHRTNIFSSTKAGQFWVVGAATSKKEEAYDVVEEIPSVWHFSESEGGGYIDLGYRIGLADSGFRVYPDAYPEATLRRSDWSQSRTLPVARNQISDFGAKNLPIPANDSSTKWTDVVNGIYTFDARLPYACYNWEVFFHAPLLIADQLSKQHKFEDAERWFRYVFDPTSTKSGDNAKRFLKFRVFNELNLNKQVIDDLTALAQAAGGFATDADIVAVEKLINRWRDAPFRPFLIARRRHIAFLWRTLFAYLDNLIAWADSLYRRDTIESINEATMLYVLAERILGRRPKLHKGSSNREALSYEAMAGKLDEFANYWIDVVTKSSNRPTHLVLKNKDGKKQPSSDGMLYFCIPFNNKILSYWNTVDARLGNIRACRNIEGIKRTLPLMDAPIDPELLIRATALGLDLGDVIAGLYAPPPHYRYSILSARAAELTNEAKALGAAMLSAIEKRDAEHLAQLRSSNEINLLKLVKEVRTLQITEAERNIDALRGSRKTIESRYNQYQRLLGKKDIKVPEEGGSAGDESMLGTIDSGLASNRSNWGLIKEENEQYLGIENANGWSNASTVAKIIGAGINAGISFSLADPTGNAYKVAKGIADAASATGDGFSFISQNWRTYADQQGMLASHIRRRDEWAFQSNQALKELQQIDKQILANQIRIDITAKELNNHIEQIEQAKAVDEVMRSKFSNEQLYEWMKTELSKLYFNAYRMALEMARKAERAASRELGVKPLNILGNAYWDSLRDGLLAGERLHQDLKRLEIAYLDQNRREFELTKHISLRRLNPEALVNLRLTKIVNDKKHNKCEFKIPEWLFDLDTPGHYLRRIKSVSVSIPSVVGPYTSVNCKLTLLSSNVRHDRGLKENSRYLRLTTANGGLSDDDRFTDYYGASEAIVTSTGNGDSGLFETQLGDERFLPFEGSGVISEWRLELPADYPQFDYASISDVVLSIRYTARDGGDTLRDAATSAFTTLLNPAATSQNPEPLAIPVVLSCKSDFSTEWGRGRAMLASQLEIRISRNLLPYWLDAARVNGNKLEIKKIAYTKLVENQSTPVSFIDVDATNWPINKDGHQYARLTAIDNATTDVIAVLWVGKR